MIGIFDSGIGGLTVVRALMEIVPKAPLVYLGDTARTPYGNKSAATIKANAFEAASFLVKKGARILVIACNTVSSYAAEELEEHFKLPVFEVVGPGVDLALKVSRKLRIGVIGTRATVESQVYPRRILQLNPQAKVFSAACPLLVPLVEEGWLNRPETNRIVKKYLHPLKVKQIDTLILGCTHYPLLKKTIQRKIGMRVTLVDSAHALALRVKAFLEADGRGGLQSGDFCHGDTCVIYVTDDAGQFRETAGLILKKTIPVVRIGI